MDLLLGYMYVNGSNSVHCLIRRMVVQPLGSTIRADFPAGKPRG